MQNAQQNNATATPSDKQPPWYRLPIVWMVIGGPAIVVVASLFTVGIAVKHVDPVIDVTKTPSEPGLAPAVQARNHAAEKSYQPADR
jgi:hypothetical protein